MEVLVALYRIPRGLQRGRNASVRLQNQEILWLAVAGPPADLGLVLRAGEAVQPSSSSSGEHHQGVRRHFSKLKDKRPVKQHDDHAVDPLEDGGGVLQGEALLAKKDSTW